MANRFWVGGSGIWDNSDTTHWAATSGGPGGQSVPGSGDDVFFDGNSGTGTVSPTATLPAVAGVYCKSIDFTGWSGTIYTNLGTNYSTIWNVYGNFTFSPTMTMSGTKNGAIRFWTPNAVINTNNISSVGTVSWIFYDGLTFTVNGDFNISDEDIYMFGCVSGTFNNNVSVRNVIVTSSNTLNMGTGTWTIYGYDGQWNTGYKAFDIRSLTTLNGSSSTIKFTNNSSNTKTFAGLNKTYNNLWINTSGTGTTYITGSNTFNDLKIDAGRTVYFTDLTDQTVTTFTAVGTYSNKITLRGTGTLGWKISDTSGTNACEWLDISYSIAEGGATFNTTGYVNGGNNSGWNFIAALPVVTTDSSSLIDKTTASQSGTVVVDGGGTITQRGICWKFSPGPTISDNISTVAGTTGSYTAALINLTPGAIHYVKAFATNSAGTAYGSEKTITTLNNTISVSDVLNISESKTTSPATIMSVNKNDLLNVSESVTKDLSLIVTTQAVSSIGVLTATGNGTITTVGSANATLRGVVWSTSSWGNPGNVAPTASNYGSKSEASGSFSAGAYTSSMTGLVSRTTYYVRAYAYNPYGYFYGEEVSFTTLGFTNPQNAYSADNVYATFPVVNGDLYVELSKDAGANWTVPQYKTFTGSDSLLTYGNGASELWGSSWTEADLTDANFRVRLSQGSIKQVYKGFGFSTGSNLLTGIEIAIEAHYTAPNLYIDILKAKIYYGTSILPVQPGSQAYASDGRKAGEGAGAGTGVLVYYDGANNWIASDTGLEVQA